MDQDEIMYKKKYLKYKLKYERLRGGAGAGKDSSMIPVGVDGMVHMPLVEKKMPDELIKIILNEMWSANDPSGELQSFVIQSNNTLGTLVWALVSPPFDAPPPHPYTVADNYIAPRRKIPFDPDKPAQIMKKNGVWLPITTMDTALETELLLEQFKQAGIKYSQSIIQTFIEKTPTVIPGWYCLFQIPDTFSKHTVELIRNIVYAHTDSLSAMISKDPTKSYDKTRNVFIGPTTPPKHIKQAHVPVVYETMPREMKSVFIKAMFTAGEVGGDVEQPVLGKLVWLTVNEGSPLATHTAESIKQLNLPLSTCDNRETVYNDGNKPTIEETNAVYIPTNQQVCPTLLMKTLKSVLANNNVDNTNHTVDAFIEEHSSGILPGWHCLFQFPKDASKQTIDSILETVKAQETAIKKLISDSHSSKSYDTTRDVHIGTGTPPEPSKSLQFSNGVIE